METMKRIVFADWHPKDRESAQWLMKYLAHYDCLYVDTLDFENPAYLRQFSTCIFFISKHFLAAQECMKKLELAAKAGKNILFIAIEPKTGLFPSTGSSATPWNRRSLSSERFDRIVAGLQKTGIPHIILRLSRLREEITASAHALVSRDESDHLLGFIELYADPFRESDEEFCDEYASLRDPDHAPTLDRSDLPETPAPKVPVQTADPQNGAPFIFASYAHKNRSALNGILADLQRDFSLWYDKDLQLGERYDADIAEHIDGCDLFIAFISSEYLNSEYCVKELKLAGRRGKPVFLVYLEDVALPLELDLHFGGLHALFLSHCINEETLYRELTASAKMQPFRRNISLPEKASQENDTAPAVRCEPPSDSGIPGLVCERSGRVYPLPDGLWIFGSDPEYCHHCITDFDDPLESGVTPSHFSIRSSDNGCVLTDLHQRIGSVHTCLNDRSHFPPEQPLKNGDMITAGALNFIFYTAVPAKTQPVLTRQRTGECIRLTEGSFFIGPDTDCDYPIDSLEGDDFHRAVFRILPNAVFAGDAEYAIYDCPPRVLRNGRLIKVEVEKLFGGDTVTVCGEEFLFRYM